MHLDTVRFLKALILPCSIFEVRAIGCVERGQSFVAAGYFDDAETAAGWIAKLDAEASPAGVYVTLNPVNHALHARAANKIVGRLKNTTTDADVLRRTRLLIDVDAVRPAGVSASDAELAESEAVAGRVAAFLASEGWPDPIRLHSGNGQHLIYGVDLPADDAGLVGRVLSGLAGRFDTAGATIDRAVANPARITKVAGTITRKGDDYKGSAAAPARPHRRSAILACPDVLDVVPVALLERVAVEPPTIAYTERNGQDSGIGHTPDEVASWLADRGVTVRGKIAKPTGTALLLDRCPVTGIESTGHSDIAVLVSDGGKLAYSNLHARGQGLQWKDLRAAIDKPRIDVGVDLSGVLGQGKAAGPTLALSKSGFESRSSDEPDTPPVHTPEPGLPSHLFDVPGFMGDVMAYSLAWAKKPHRELALAGAIALQAVLAGRKVRDRTGMRTNLYLLTMARSGQGKGNALDTISSIVAHAGISRYIWNGGIASDAGLISCMATHPSRLLLIDEIGKFFISAVGKFANPHAAAVLALLTRLFTAPRGPFDSKSYADVKKNTTIDDPCVSLLGATTQHDLSTALSGANIADGFLGRMMIFQGEDWLPLKQPDEQQPGDEILDVVAEWDAFNPGGNLAAQHPEPLVIKESPEAAGMFDELARQTDEMGKPGKDETKAALWSRTTEKARRLALVYACSERRTHAIVDAPAASWACELATFLSDRMCRMAEHWIADGPFDARQKQVIRLLAERGGVISRTQLNRLTKRWTSRERTDVLINMQETGQVSIEVEKGKTNTGATIRLLR